jgi:hypothetical protein
MPEFFDLFVVALSGDFLGGKFLLEFDNFLLVCLLADSLDWGLPVMERPHHSGVLLGIDLFSGEFASQDDHLAVIG